MFKKKGLIRELHVYGNVTPVGKTNSNVQHSGIGKKLLKEAERISWNNNCDGVVVISGEGVRGYYEKMGFRERETFMVKEFININYIWLFIVIITFIIYICN